MFLALSAVAARAEDFSAHAGDLSLRVAAAGVLFDSGAKFKLAGQSLPGANLHLTDAATVVAEFGYFVTPDVSVTLTVGVPPEATAQGRGLLQGAGDLGKLRYGPVALLANYNFNQFGRIKPWVGVGPAVFLVFSAKDGAVQNLHVDDHLGVAFQAGGEYRFNRRYGLYGSVTKALLTTNGHGDFGGFPASAKVDLNPVVIQGGVTFHF